MRSFPIQAQFKKTINYNTKLSFCSSQSLNFLIFKVYGETKALCQASLIPHKGFTMCSRWYLFLAHSPEAFIQANTIKFHQSGKVHDTVSYVSFKGPSLTHHILEPQELLPAHCLSLQTSGIYFHLLSDVQVHFLN